MKRANITGAAAYAAYSAAISLLHRRRTCQNNNYVRRERRRPALNAGCLRAWRFDVAFFSKNAAS